MPFKCLRNFWRPLEMLLDKRKIDLKRKWSNCCLFSENSNRNMDDNPNNIMFTIKDTTIKCLCSHIMTRKRLSKTIENS